MQDLVTPSAGEERLVGDKITPMVLTLNEVENVRYTIEKLLWTPRIVVIDSGSTDGTLETLSHYPQVEVIHRPFDNFANQCNFGLSQIRTEWVLSLDADYELSDELVREVHELSVPKDVTGYQARFVYRIHGRPLRGSLYPRRTVLYRARAAHYTNEGHGHRVLLPGEVRCLRGAIYHDDRKPLARWFSSQQGYARLEADFLLNAEPQSLSHNDRIRRLGWLAPVLVLPYVLVAKGCGLDGWAGWYYALQRLLAEGTIALELLDRRLRGGDGRIARDVSLADDPRRTVNNPDPDAISAGKSDQCGAATDLSQQSG